MSSFSLLTLKATVAEVFCSRPPALREMMKTDSAERRHESGTEVHTCCCQERVDIGEHFPGVLSSLQQRKRFIILWLFGFTFSIQLIGCRCSREDVPEFMGAWFTTAGSEKWQPAASRRADRLWLLRHELGICGGRTSSLNSNESELLLGETRVDFNNMAACEISQICTQNTQYLSLHEIQGQAKAIRDRNENSVYILGEQTTNNTWRGTKGLPRSDLSVLLWFQRWSQWPAYVQTNWAVILISVDLTVCKLCSFFEVSESLSCFHLFLRFIYIYIF